MAYNVCGVKKAGEKKNILSHFFAVACYPNHLFIHKSVQSLTHVSFTLSLYATAAVFVAVLGAISITLERGRCRKWNIFWFTIDKVNIVFQLKFQLFVKFYKIYKFCWNFLVCNFIYDLLHLQHIHTQCSCVKTTFFFSLSLAIPTSHSIADRICERGEILESILR